MSNFQCDRCGGVFSDKHKAVEWTGAIVCKGPGTRNCWEPRHPQDFVRSLHGDITVRDARVRSNIAIYDKTPGDYPGWVLDHTDYFDESDLLKDRYVTP